jgi:hypothetical protein
MFCKLTKDEKVPESLTGIQLNNNNHYCKDLHDPIEGDSARPSNITEKECEKMHTKTIGYVTDNGLTLACFIMFLKRWMPTVFVKNWRVYMRGRKLEIKLSQLESL